jgi:hypothetical protein
MIKINHYEGKMEKIVQGNGFTVEENTEKERDGEATQK